jgi:hypothetical protein
MGVKRDGGTGVIMVLGVGCVIVSLMKLGVRENG